MKVMHHCKTCWSRREFLFRSGGGVSGLALAYLLNQDRLLAGDNVDIVHSAACEGTAVGFNPYAPKAPHFKPRATAVISLFMSGGVSHVDTFDPKPALAKYAGQPLDDKVAGDVIVRQGHPGPLMPSPFAFKKYGKSGLWVSDLFPHIAGVADDLTVIRSMTADSANHTPALFVLNTGFQFNGYPSLGGWLSYGLGTLTDDLPAFVVLPDGRGEVQFRYDVRKYDPVVWRRETLRPHGCQPRDIRREDIATAGIQS